LTNLEVWHLQHEGFIQFGDGHATLRVLRRRLTDPNIRDNGAIR
jgi:hypothetical protein